MADHGLTAAQRKRLAREMRKLAMECVEGTAPPLAVGWIGGGHCAVRWSARRARVPFDPMLWGATIYAEWDFSDEPATIAALVLVAEENDAAAPEDRPFAVVFPLLAAADAIEEVSNG